MLEGSPLVLPLGAGRVVVRRPAVGDEDALVRLFISPEVRRYLGGGLEVGVARKRAERMTAVPSGDFVIVSAMDGAVLGSGDVRRKRGPWEFSYQLLPQFWGRGLASDAVRAVVVAFHAVKPDDVLIAVTQDGNHRSRALLEGLGAVPDGTFEEYGAAQRRYVLRRGDVSAADAGRSGHPPVTVRLATSSDVDAAGELTEQVYRVGGWAGEAYARELRDARTRMRQALLYVAVLDRQVVGTVTLALPGTRLAEIARDHESEVRMLAVAEHVRGRGVGTLLLAVCEARSREAGLTGVVLSTETDMHAAHRLYHRRGYRRAYERDWRVADFDMLVYHRPIPSR
ncbi:GNAT family N-acetyltransferase [Cryptosporangium minutisporangium]|uniref:N-acetyltransferase domain-containing protein n=1 Tax=Cryptosporangium minutisporangium TaxID=113569 RepID=A0ABP6T526_9ACTN